MRPEDDLRAEGNPHPRVERRRGAHPQRRHVRHEPVYKRIRNFHKKNFVERPPTEPIKW